MPQKAVRVARKSHHMGFGTDQARCPLSVISESRGLVRMSASPPKADIGRTFPEVRLVPEADSCGAANSSPDEHRRHVDAERLPRGRISSSRIGPSDHLGMTEMRFTRP